MKILRLAGIAILTLFLFMGCSGNNANIRNLSQSESKAIQQELLVNWSDLDISYHTAVLVFDPKNDDKKILVGNYWGTVKDQETWTRLINGSERLPGSWQTNIVWGNQIREIWVNNQFYGYISNQSLELISAKIVDENTVRLFRTRSAAPIT
ncbi:MAG: hypothetical protein QNJ58_26090 [Desulfobacterales bacterium]|nr:hypothetical protein [Desulfobacterales bacterium]